MERDVLLLNERVWSICLSRYFNGFVTMYVATWESCIVCLHVFCNNVYSLVVHVINVLWPTFFPKNEQLQSLAEESQMLKDEMDVLRHSQEKVVCTLFWVKQWLKENFHIMKTITYSVLQVYYAGKFW